MLTHSPNFDTQVTEVIKELYNMTVVGWYHSHPSFPALPSVIDIANQLQVGREKGCRCGCVFVLHFVDIYV